MDAGDIRAVRPISGPLDLRCRPPGSKSLTNRALLAAALGRGRSTISSLLIAEDTSLMMAALRQLGVELHVDPLARRATIKGGDGRWSVDEAEIFCGNAGTVLRFLIAATCIGFGEYRLDGSARLRQRPVAELLVALRHMGAMIECEHREGYCPLRVEAQGLLGGHLAMRHVVSSQHVSGLLLAAPYARRDTMLELPEEWPSAPYASMTLAVMSAFGVSAIQDGSSRFVIPSDQRYAAADYEVEPDASSASYFFAAAALLGGHVCVEGLGAASCQGDLRFVDVLRDMGCTVMQDERQTTVVGPADGRLRGVEADLRTMPDVAPTLAVLAAFADTRSRLSGIAGLRIKESDRIAALADGLSRIGGKIEIEHKGIIVHPAGRLRPARIDSYDDHRIAMSFALAGLRLEGIEIAGAGCVAKTFPGFFDAWEHLADGRVEG